MSNSEIDAWPVGVADKLKTYVYRLIDPRNGETFYIGKGRGDRVFADIRADVDGDELDNKLKRIREIRVAGFEVAHVIHRHGLDDATAFEVEAALIDSYPGLTNVAGGTGSGDFGAMHAKEIIRRYEATPAVFRHRALLINVNRSATETSLYQATRYAWKIDKRKAAEAEVVLATRQGLIVGAFVATAWLDATAATSPVARSELSASALSATRHPPNWPGPILETAFQTRIGNAGPRIRSNTRGSVGAHPTAPNSGCTRRRPRHAVAGRVTSERGRRG